MLHPSIAFQERLSHMAPRTTDAQAARPGTMRPVNLLIALFAVAWLVSVVLYRRMFADERRHVPDVLRGADATEAM